MRKQMGTAAATALVAGMLVVVPTSAASASTACSGTSITINATAGGEAPRTVNGHTHATGKHYVYSISTSKLWTWWADNDNGSTDKPDSPYGIIQC